MERTKNILVAPLNWGLGHATRCIPIIEELMRCNYNPIIASDGAALELLKKEYPELTHINLPSYNVTYSKEAKNFQRKMFFNSPRILWAVILEKIKLNRLIKTYNIDGVISDNRLGLFTSQVPTVFMTHQLNVLSGKTTKLSSKLHQTVVKLFSECWVPDLKDKPNLSGRLGHVNHNDLNVKYIGPISRFKKQASSQIEYDYLVLLSGPEPQRTLLENKLFNQLKHTDKKILFVRGKVEAVKRETKLENITLCNFMTSSELEYAINRSDVVISRSGYTTIMDLARLEKKAFFIPTPGQFEQEYLAKRLKNQQLVPYATQETFHIDKLQEVILYKGLKNLSFATAYKDLFTIFEKAKDYEFSNSLAVSKVKENSDPTPNSLST